MKFRVTLEPEGVVRLCLEFSLRDSNHYSHGMPDLNVSHTEEPSRQHEIPDEDLHSYTNQRGNGPMTTAARKSFGSFVSLLRWLWKLLCMAKFICVWLASAKKVQGCVSTCCSLCITQEAASSCLHDNPGTKSIARSTEDSTPDARRDAALEYWVNFCCLQACVREFASYPGSFQQALCTKHHGPPRGGDSVAHYFRPTILLSQDQQSRLEILNFSVIQILFKKSNGKMRGVVALQDTGATINAIALELIEELGLTGDIIEIDQADNLNGTSGLGGGAPVQPSATIELPIWKCCDLKNALESQKFNVFTKDQLLGHNVLLGAALTESLGHLQRIRCEKGCDNH